MGGGGGGLGYLIPAFIGSTGNNPLRYDGRGVQTIMTGFYNNIPRSVVFLTHGCHIRTGAILDFWGKKRKDIPA